MTRAPGCPVCGAVPVVHADRIENACEHLKPVILEELSGKPTVAFWERWGKFMEKLDA